MAKMTTLELEGLLDRLQNSATGAFNSSIGNHRSDLMKRYLGLHYGDEVDGRSKIVDTTVRDTIEAIKPELMDIFFGGDRVVEFVPRGEEDIEAAEQETDVCNWIFQQQNDGFMILYNWITDALFQKTGYVKRYWDEQKRTEIEEYDELTPDEAALLLDELEQTSDEVEILERSGGIQEDEDGLPVLDKMGQPVIEPLYLKIRRTDTSKRYTIVNVPPEEVIVHPQWTRVDFKGCPFVAHKRPVTVSELIQMGFNRKEVEELPTYDRKLESEEATTRFSDQEFHETEFNSTDDSMREVLVYENYVLADYDGDGIAEQLQVFTGGSSGKILKRGRKLAIEQVTDAPFEVLSPLPIPHRHYGISVAELVTDLQKLKTVMTRQLVDNIVGSNNPDMVVDQDNLTPEATMDLSYTGLGRTIRIPGGVQSAQYLQPPQTAQQSLAAIEYIDQLRENRTGVSRMNQGLDPNAIRDLAQGTVKNFMSAAQKKILMIARVFAETGYKSLFVNMHRDLRAGPVKEIAVKLNNGYVTVNPRTWRNRTDVTVSVGLGTGDRDVQMARLAQLYAEQKEGFASGLIGYEKLHHTLTKMTELAGFKDVANFWPDPQEVEQRMQMAQRNQQPDANMELVKVEAGKVRAKAMADVQAAQLKAIQARLDAQEMALNARLDRMRVDNERLKILMQDDRERDIASAKISADAAKAQDVDYGPQNQGV